MPDVPESVLGAKGNDALRLPAHGRDDRHDLGLPRGGSKHPRNRTIDRSQSQHGRPLLPLAGERNRARSASLSRSPIGISSPRQPISSAPARAIRRNDPALDRERGGTSATQGAL